MAKTPIKVEITETRHKMQPFTVRIEKGKTDLILSQRYTRVESAKKGALRKLKAYKLGGPPHPHYYDGPDPLTARKIVFVIKPARK